MPSPRSTVEKWLAQLDRAPAARDLVAVASMFRADASWRDLLAFSWNIVTTEGTPGIRGLLESTLERTAPRGFELDECLRPCRDDRGTIEGWFRFSSSVGDCIGLVRLRDGRADTLLTTLETLHARPEAVGPRRPFGDERSQGSGAVAWHDARQTALEALDVERQPYALVVGGGQSGLALAARLRHLQVPTLVIDENPRPGDAWRRRYKTLSLHDPVWYDHMPYLPFPSGWPVNTPKNKLADWLAGYASTFEAQLLGRCPV